MVARGADYTTTRSKPFYHLSHPYNKATLALRGIDVKLSSTELLRLMLLRSVCFDRHFNYVFGGIR